jgi:hypothetical protein
MWNIDPIPTLAILYICKCIENMYPNVGLVENTKGESKEGKNDSK